MSRPEEVPLPDPRCGRTREADIGGVLLSEFVLEPDFHLGFHRHDASALFLWLEGRLQVDVGRERWALSQPGEILAMPAGLAHREYAGSEGGRCLMIRGAPGTREAAEIEEVVGGDAGGVAPPVPTLPRVLERALEGTPSLRNRLRARAACLDLVATLSDRPGGQGAYASPPWLQALDRWLEHHFREAWSLEELAERFGVSPGHLARSYQATYDSTVGERIRALRLDHAAGRLRNSELAIPDIAAEAGFSDQSHLTRCFRRRFGTTPARYRRSEARRGTTGAR